MLGRHGGESFRVHRRSVQSSTGEDDDSKLYMRTFGTSIGIEALYGVSEHEISVDEMDLPHLRKTVGAFAVA
jgi:hypothetical protein